MCFFRGLNQAVSAARRPEGIPDREREIADGRGNASAGAPDEADVRKARRKPKDGRIPAPETYVPPPNVLNRRARHDFEEGILTEKLDLQKRTDSAASTSPGTGASGSHGRKYSSNVGDEPFESFGSVTKKIRDS